jgi:hypothetical protein
MGKVLGMYTMYQNVYVVKKIVNTVIQYAIVINYIVIIVNINIYEDLITDTYILFPNVCVKKLNVSTVLLNVDVIVLIVITVYANMFMDMEVDLFTI